jgi:copper transporter 1
MLWNWNVIDSCFLASSWHITNNAMFAASCVGAAMLVVCLEFLRRVGHEYDAHLVRQFERQMRRQQAALMNGRLADCCDGPITTVGTQYATFRASALQQLVRAVIHGITLGVAYIVMLLIMHYNGYIFISVILGAILGKFLCDWMVVRMQYANDAEKNVRARAFEAAGPTGCCA